MTYAIFGHILPLGPSLVCRALRLLNRSSLLLGSLSAAGLVLIANFQSIDKPHFNNGTSLDVDGAEVIHKFHWSGAFFTFVIGTVWMFVQVSESGVRPSLCTQRFQINLQGNHFPR